MAIILIGFALLCILLLLVLYRNLPNKKVFYGFCGTLSIALGISYYSFHVPQSQPVHLDEAAISHITSQQQIFAGWYTEYKKHLDVIDYTWQQYQQLLKDYHNDNQHTHHHFCYFFNTILQTKRTDKKGYKNKRRNVC